MAIIMIGFPSFSHVKVPGFEFDEKTATDYTSDPTNAQAIASYRTELNRLDDWRATNSDKSLSPRTKASLESTTNLMEQQRNLPAESLVALAHAQLLLGATNMARATLDSAIHVKPTLKYTISPGLQELLRQPSVR